MRGASAIVVTAGQDAVDAGDAASRGAWVTSACGQDGSSVVRIPLGQKIRIPLGQKRRLSFR
jgi:hypothetical protein